MHLFCFEFLCVWLKYCSCVCDSLDLLLSECWNLVIFDCMRSIDFCEKFEIFLEEFFLWGICADIEFFFEEGILMLLDYVWTLYFVVEEKDSIVRIVCSQVIWFCVDGMKLIDLFIYFLFIYMHIYLLFFAV